MSLKSSFFSFVLTIHASVDIDIFRPRRKQCNSCTWTLNTSNCELTAFVSSFELTALLNKNVPWVAEETDKKLLHFFHPELTGLVKKFLSAN